MAMTSERPVAAAASQTGIWDYARTGPGTLAGRYMRRFWQPVHLSAQLQPGRTKPIRIMSEDFTLYRGEGGIAHVLAFRCAHRGTQLSTGWVEGDNIRCFYHGWTYDGSGQCVEQPAEPEPFCQRISIRGYPTQEYLGIVWAYLGEGEAPPFRRIPQLEQETETNVRMVRGGRVAPYNFANIMENDPAHVPFVHRETQFFTDIPRVSAVEMEYGSKETVTFSNREGYVHRVMPNGRMFVTPINEGGWTENLIFQVPVDDESHLGFGIQFHHVSSVEALPPFRERMARQIAGAAQGPLAEIAARVLRGEITLAEVEDRTNLVNLQDLVSQWGQGTIRNEAQDRLGRSDAGVVMLRGLWERELRAFENGQPLKDWTIPERIELTPDYHG
jgi:5,5'-dehydrodivanillate O-demethylase